MLGALQQVAEQLELARCVTELAVHVMQLTKEGISGTFRGVVSEIGRMTSDGVTTLGTMSFQQFKPTEWKASTTARFQVWHTVEAVEMLLFWQHMMQPGIYAHAYTSEDLHAPLHACTAGLMCEVCSTSASGMHFLILMLIHLSIEQTVS